MADSHQTVKTEEVVKYGFVDPTRCKTAQGHFSVKSDLWLQLFSTNIKH